MRNVQNPLTNNNRYASINELISLRDVAAHSDGSDIGRTMMTVSPITSKQKQHFENILARAVKRARKEANPGSDGMQRLFARGGEFEDWFVAGIRQFTAKLPDYTLARFILGGDFISPEEIMVRRPGIIYTEEQIQKLAEMIPSEEKLRWFKDNGYAVVAAPPYALSLLQIRALESDIFYSETGGWYANEKETFAHTDKTSFGWLAIRKTPVPESTNKNWNEQIRLISDVEYIPNAAEMSWFITTFFKVRGVKLFADIYVRTSSLDSDGFHVIVSHFAGGLDVSGDWDSDRNSYLGLASARK